MECSKNTISPYTPISTFFDNGDNMAAFFIACTATADGQNTGLTVRSPIKKLFKNKVKIVCLSACIYISLTY